MPTPSEQKALAFVAMVVLLGGAVRIVRAGSTRAASARSAGDGGRFCGGRLAESPEIEGPRQALEARVGALSGRRRRERPSREQLGRYRTAGPIRIPTTEPPDRRRLPQ